MLLFVCLPAKTTKNLSVLVISSWRTKSISRITQRPLSPCFQMFSYVDPSQVECQQVSTDMSPPTLSLPTLNPAVLH